MQLKINKVNLFGLLLLLSTHIQSVWMFFDPITLSAIGIGGAAISYFFKDQTICKLKECCNDRSIPGDTYGK